MRIAEAVVVVIVLAAACSRSDQQPAKVAPAATAPRAPAAPPSAAASWWCTSSPDGEANWCGRQLEWCQTARQSFAKLGHELAECTAHASVFCFSATGDNAERCSADLAICRTQRDTLVANPSGGAPTSDCVIVSPSQNAATGTAPPADPPRWSCTTAIDEPFERCDRQPGFCETFREVATKNGHKMGECVSHESAFCVARRRRSESRFGLAHLVCAAGVSACRRILDDQARADDVELLSDCTEQR